MRYGKKWKSYRRLFHEHMGPAPVKDYEDTMRKGADSLLARLEKDPKDYRRHAKLSVPVFWGLDVPVADSSCKVCRTPFPWKSRMDWV